MTGTGFEVLLASPPDYKSLVAEIYFEGKFVALVNQERGPGLFDVETPGVELVKSKISRKVDLRGFITAIESACDRLRGK